MNNEVPRIKFEDFESSHLSISRRCLTLVRVIFDGSSRLIDEDIFSGVTSYGSRISWDVDGVRQEDDTCTTLRLREALYATQPQRVDGLPIDSDMTDTTRMQYGVQTTLDATEPRAYILECARKDYSASEDDNELDWRQMVCIVASSGATPEPRVSIVDAQTGHDLNELEESEIHQIL